MVSNTPKTPQTSGQWWKPERLLGRPRGLDQEVKRSRHVSPPLVQADAPRNDKENHTMQPLTTTGTTTNCPLCDKPITANEPTISMIKTRTSNNAPPPTPSPAHQNCFRQRIINWDR
jgi:hypothetical protein